MNTGVHDAVNLAWKLGGVVKGWYTIDVLQAYDTERRPAAQQLIELDKAFSATISGRIPDTHKGLYDDANELFTKIFDDTIQFNIGLGIYYPKNILNKAPSTGMVSAGWRAPDALTYAPGSRFPTRLFHRTKNSGQWSILVFAGQPLMTRGDLVSAVESLRKSLESFPRGMLRFLTLVAQSAPVGDSMFDLSRIGNVYYDQDRAAHAAYTMSAANGAVVALRPDGILGHATSLDDVDGMVSFLRGFTQSS